jgi:phthiocerol/phenolphthiocerol synthesis type-I polyketide synthase E
VEAVFPAGLMQRMLDAYVLLLQRLAADEAAWRETAPVAAPSACYEQWHTALTLSPERGHRPHPKPTDGAAHAAPRDELERQLVGLWETTLEVQGIGIADNFFDLGGNSFLAVRLLAGIQKRFGVELPLAALYEGGTVAYVAGMLRR